MIVSKAEVELFFRRNPALCERKDEILQKLPDVDGLTDDVLRHAMGEVLLGFLKFDMSHDAPWEGGDTVRKALVMIEETLITRYINISAGLVGL